MNSPAVVSSISQRLEITQETPVCVCVCEMICDPHVNIEGNETIGMGANIILRTLMLTMRHFHFNFTYHSLVVLQLSHRRRPLNSCSRLERSSWALRDVGLSHPRDYEVHKYPRLSGMRLLPSRPLPARLRVLDLSRELPNESNCTSEEPPISLIIVLSQQSID